MRTRFLLVWMFLQGVGFGAAEFEVFPGDINLSTVRDRQSLVVRANDGIHRDVTNEATYVVGDPSKARVEKGVVYPVADGATTLKVQWKGKTVELPIKVEQAKVDPPVSFRLDVMPVFMKAECNRCHGAARGQDGFRLSLWGFDPEGDHFRLTREMSGRRINLALPAESMLLTKSTGAAPHTGGKLFEKDSELARTLLRWLEANAPNDPPDVAKVTRVEILPKNLLLESPGQTFKMTVRAHYSDGSDRDVTSLALFLSNNEAAAKIAADGMLTTGQRGEAFVMARFSTFTVGTPVIVIPKGISYQWPQVDPLNFIDEIVHEKLRNLRMTPSELCSDEVFLRRAFIDLTGSLPNPEELLAFVADPTPDKRARRIDELLKRPEFVDLWALKWSELLQIRTDKDTSNKSTLIYYDWLHEQLRKQVPINEIARTLLTASGSCFENPPVNYYQLEQDPLKLAEDTAQAFFGIRVQCAQCHNHPFDRWTMDDYRGFVAFFAQIGRKTAEDPREKIIFNNASGESKHPVSNQAVPPKFLGGDAPDCTGKDRRQVLADWIAAPDNPYFPRHVANLIWAQYMGRGIIEPVDDARISNPPSNPELLEALARKVVEYQYDLRRLVREVCTSRTYQLASRPTESSALDERNFAHATIRRMRAEVLLDCISQVTSTKEKFRGLQAGARSVEVPDGKTSNYFLTTFGRSTRETICSREEVGPTLSQALHLINGTTIEQKLSQGGVVKAMLAANKAPEEIATELYLRCLGRRPTEAEIQKLQPFWADKKDATVFQDLFWALLNSKEFLFNH